MYSTAVNQIKLRKMKEIFLDSRILLSIRNMYQSKIQIKREIVGNLIMSKLVLIQSRRDKVRQLYHRGALKVHYGARSENIAKMMASAISKMKNLSSALFISMKMDLAILGSGTNSQILKMDTVLNTTSAVQSTKDTGKKMSIMDMEF